VAKRAKDMPRETEMKRKSSKKLKITLIVAIPLVIAAILFLWKGIGLFGAGASSVELTNFHADIFDVEVGTQQKVTFSVNANFKGKHKNVDGIEVLDGQEVPIANMHDDGKDGDILAGDGIYIAATMIERPERANVTYWAQYHDEKSSTFEICFFSPITGKEFTSFMELSNSIEAAKDYNSAKTLIVSQKDVTEYIADDEAKTILYKTIYGPSGSWHEELSSNFKGTQSHAISLDLGLDYSAVESVVEINEYKLSLANSKIQVLRPFRNSDFKYDDFKQAGQVIASASNGKLTVHDDEKASLDSFKQWDDFDIVLIDSHGTFLGGDPYILTGQHFTMKSFSSFLELSSDLLSGRVVFNATKGVAQIGATFFRKYYPQNAIRADLIFLGTCQSMHNDRLAATLTYLGAKVVLGYTDNVMTNYCNATLFETLINRMILSSENVEEGINAAKKNYGNVDPGNQECAFKLFGDNQYSFNSVANYEPSASPIINLQYLGRAIGEVKKLDSSIARYDYVAANINADVFYDPLRYPDPYNMRVLYSNKEKGYSYSVDFEIRHNSSTSASDKDTIVTVEGSVGSLMPSETSAIRTRDFLARLGVKDIYVLDHPFQEDQMTELTFNYKGKYHIEITDSHGKMDLDIISPDYMMRVSLIGSGTIGTADVKMLPFEEQILTDKTWPYKEVLEQFASEPAEDKNGRIRAFALKDIDGNGIQELIVDKFYGYGYGEFGLTQLYTIVDGKPVKLFDEDFHYGDEYLFFKGGVIRYHMHISSNEYYRYYRISTSGASLSASELLDSQRVYEGDSDYGVVSRRYYYGDGRINKSEFEDIMNGYEGKGEIKIDIWRATFGSFL
jgi:hypothetical protein